MGAPHWRGFSGSCLAVPGTCARGAQTCGGYALPGSPQPFHVSSRAPPASRPSDQQLLGDWLLLEGTAQTRLASKGRGDFTLNGATISPGKEAPL